MKGFLLISLLLCFVQCTVEKRLYNRGFHVERSQKFHSDKHPANLIVNSESDEVTSEETTVESAITLKANDTVLIPKESDLVESDDTLVQPKDSIGFRLSQAYTKERKKQVLIGIGVPMALVAAGAGILFYVSVTATSGGFTAGLIAAFVGLFLSGVLLLLLVLFLIFLIRKADGRKVVLKSPDRRLSKAQRLLIISAVIFVVVLVGGYVAPLLDD